MRIVGIPIAGITSPPGENEHQLWDNPYMKNVEPHFGELGVLSLDTH